MSQLLNASNASVLPFSVCTEKNEKKRLIKIILEALYIPQTRSICEPLPKHKLQHTHRQQLLQLMVGSNYSTFQQYIEIKNELLHSSC